MRLIGTIALSENKTVSSQKTVTRRCRGAGFTLMEILVVMALLMMLVIAAISALTLLDRSSLRQAQHTTAVEVAQGRLDEILATKYEPPKVPFTSTNYTVTTNATLTISKSGTNATTVAVVTSLVEPAGVGHVATVIVRYTNYDQPTSVRLQTLINKHSGGQP